MKHTSIAAALLLAIPALSLANPPRQCHPYGPCGGFCIGLFSKIHQHGPLFNYGPYYGYPPFEPYGPWNAYLQYNPWYYNQGGRCHGCGHGHHWGHRCGHGHGCGRGCGQHAHWLHGGWFRGNDCLSCGHHWGLCRKSNSCRSTCATTCGPNGCAAPAAPGATPPVTAPSPKEVKQIAFEQVVTFDPTGDPAARYTGVGSVESTAVYYSGLPTLNPALTPAGY